MPHAHACYAPLHPRRSQGGYDMQIKLLTIGNSGASFIGPAARQPAAACCAASAPPTPHLTTHPSRL